MRASIISSSECGLGHCQYKVCGQNENWRSTSCGRAPARGYAREVPKSWLMQRSKPPSYSIAPGKQGRRYLALAVFKLITSSRNARARLAERAAPGECD